MSSLLHNLERVTRKEVHQIIQDTFDEFKIVKPAEELKEKDELKVLSLLYRKAGKEVCNQKVIIHLKRNCRLSEKEVNNRLDAYINCYSRFGFIDYAEIYKNYCVLNKNAGCKKNSISYTALYAWLGLYTDFLKKIVDNIDIRKEIKEMLSSEEHEHIEDGLVY